MSIGEKLIMMAKNPIKYAYLLKEIYEGKEVTCPQCGKSGLRHRFCASKKDKVGFAQFHCPNCNTDAHLCRVKFPDNVSTEELSGFGGG